MNDRFKSTLKNIMYTFMANGIAMLISATLTIMLPKMLSLSGYGYWQLYLLYISYIVFFHLGWIDGIYLKYGGQEYEKLEKRKFVTQFWLLNIFTLILSIVAAISILFRISSPDKKFILLGCCIYGVITISKTYFLYIFELSNRIKDYARYLQLDRYIYFVGVIIILLLGIRDYKILLWLDIVSRLITLILCVINAHEVAIGKLVPLKEGIIEAIDNIKIGCNLMIANVSSMLIVGIVRFGIEYKWSIETFGKVSLTMSISNFLLSMINAVGVVMFPMLRRTSKEKLSPMYSNMRTMLMIPLLGMLILYYPIKEILSVWLPKYSESLIYMALLFPMCIFECKMSLLINTYLKTLRKEKQILLVNVSTLIVSLVTMGITVFILGNLSLALVSIVVLLIFRCIFAEKLLSRYIRVHVNKDIILEIIMVITFMIVSWNIGGTISAVIYLVAYATYIIIKKDDIKETLKIVIPLLKGRTT